MPVPAALLQPSIEVCGALCRLRSFDELLLFPFDQDATVIPDNKKPMSETEMRVRSKAQQARVAHAGRASALTFFV